MPPRSHNFTLEPGVWMAPVVLENKDGLAMLGRRIHFDCMLNFYVTDMFEGLAAGEKSIEKKRKTAIEKFAKELCALGFCDGVTLKQINITLVKEKGEKKVQSVTYSYTPYCEGEAGEIIHTATGKHRFQIIRLVESDETGAYAEYVAKSIRYMSGTYLKEKFYAIPLRNLPRCIGKMKNQACRFIKSPVQSNRNSFIDP